MMVKINAPFDSDQHPKAILLQREDEIAESYCGQCHTPTIDWPYQATRHGDNRPGVMFQAELFCTGCKTWAWDEHTGERVISFTGEPDPWPSKVQHYGMHRFLRNQANEQAKQSSNCQGCGQRFMPDDVRVEGEGPMTTVFRVVAVTDAAKEWVNENVNNEEGFHPEWPNMFVEHRYLDDLIAGMHESGLQIAHTLQAVGAR